MTAVQVGLVSLAVVVFLIFIRVPVAVALVLVGFLGNSFFLGVQPALTQFQLVTWDIANNFILITLPLFILMGQLANGLGLGKDMYQCFHKWFGRLPGGLAVTAIASSASFGSVSGSSVATVAAVGKMFMPELKRYRYDPGLAAGSLASAGVLAILIPPSVPLVFYSAWTETSLGDLFVAGIVPGLLLGTLFSIYALFRCVMNPALGPAGPNYSWREKGVAVIHLLPIAVVLGVVLGSIYWGIATPTEAAAVGVLGVILIGAAKKRLTIKKLQLCLEQTVLLSSNIFLLFLGGIFFSRFLAQTELTSTMIDMISGLNASPVVIILALVMMYLLLGAILDTFGMIILTLPFTFPLVTTLGFDPVWFGVFVVMMIELALITPPIGINVFVMQRLEPNMAVGKIYYGALPFVLLSLLLVLVLIFFPQVALWLPQALK